MRHLALLTILILTACAPAQTLTAPPALATDSPAPAAPTATVSPTDTATPPATATPTRDFPNPDAYEWKVVASGFSRPVDIQNAGDGSGRLFIVEQAGVIRILQTDALIETPFLDIRERVDDGRNEQGLLGLAFHPNYESNGFFYVNYTEEGGDTVIARFHASGNIADPNSEARLLGVAQPFPNHNGGALAFGPDGFLYIGLGDGGAGGDPLGHGQNVNSLLGKILRIDVNSGEPYAIPSDNPFGNEVFHYGLRNPWRISFDSATGDLWIGDVGQGQYEEIDFLHADATGGVNFGWNRYEGFHDYASGTNLNNHTPPMFEYSHNEGCSVTGGYVYRGAMPEWQGVYFFADYCSGRLWGALHYQSAAEESFVSTLLYQTGVQILTFGVDEAGELYFGGENDGTIQRLVRK
ncbi:MAG: PQQ-dependent sugar dehydrogenase [Chloroflexi bacterium]|nr:PQQ-dependent sugar dehydrogenase [Chloroflexota bacterium]